MFDKFNIEEKKKVAEEMYSLMGEGKLIVKERFVDDVLGAEVVRVPLTVGKEYAGRDLIVVKDITKAPKACKTSELAVTHCSYTYRLIKNETVREALENELSEVVEDYTVKEKKESITDYSAAIRFEGKVILVRNSYVPSRSLQIMLGKAGRVIIPMIELRIIHAEKGLTALKLKEELEKLAMAEPILDELEKAAYWEMLPKHTIAEIKNFKIKRERIKDKKKEIVEIKIGEELIEKADKERWSGMKLIEEFLIKAYSLAGYRIKRKADKTVLNAFSEMMKTVFA